MHGTHHGEPGGRPGATTIVEVTPTGTVVSTGAGHVHVDARPDHAQARRVAGSLDRLVWQRLDRGGALVAGTRHRRPVQLHVDAGTALGLLALGLPTVAAVAREAS